MQKVNHFSLRKTAAYGLASVLIGLSLFGAKAESVKADANTTADDAPKTEVVQKQSSAKPAVDAKGNIQENTKKTVVPQTEAATKTATAPQNVAQKANAQQVSKQNPIKQPAQNTDAAKQQAPAVKANAGQKDKQNAETKPAQESKAAAQKTDNAKQNALPVKDGKPVDARKALADKIIAGANKQEPAKDKKADPKQIKTDKQMQDDIKQIANAVAPYMQEKDVTQQKFQVYWSRPQATTHYYKVQFKGSWKYQTQTEADGSVKYDVMLDYYYDFAEYWDYDMKQPVDTPTHVPLFTKETGYYSNVKDLISKINSYKSDFDNAKTYQNWSDEPWAGRKF